MLDALFSPETLAATARSLIPFLLLGLGGLLCHRVGVFNIALEGFLLMGAFAGLAGTALSGSAAVGVLAAVLCSTLMAALIAYGAVVRKGDPIIIGIALNLLVVGLTSFLLFVMFGVRGTLQDPSVSGLPRIVLPVIGDVPWAGQILNSFTILGYVAILATIGTQFYLSRTASGLRLRGVGMHPEASATLGVRPQRYQIGAVLASGVLGGLAGAQLSIGNVALFAENMSGGRGWIVVVAVLLAAGRVWPLFGVLVAFSYVDAVGIRMQNFGFPVQFSDAIPYVITLAALIAIAVATKGRSNRFRIAAR